MDAFEEYLALCPRALVLIEGGIVVWANEAMARLVHRDRNELLGAALGVVGGLPLEPPRDQLVEVALWAGNGSLLDCWAELTWLGEQVMVELDLVEARESDEEVAALRAVADVTPVGMFVSDRGLRLRYVNQALARILKARRDELVSTNWVSCFAPRDQPLVRELAMQGLRGQSTSTMLEVNLASGEPRVLEVTVVPVRGGDGRLRFAGTVNDRTGQRRELLAHEAASGSREGGGRDAH